MCFHIICVMWLLNIEFCIKQKLCLKMFFPSKLVFNGHFFEQVFTVHAKKKKGSYRKLLCHNYVPVYCVDFLFNQTFFMIIKLFISYVISDHSHF